MRFSYLCLMFVLALNDPALAQEPGAPSVLESFQRAAVLLDSAVTAHGGIGAIRLVRNVRLRMQGYDHHRNQSRGVSPPYDSTSLSVDLMIDLSRGHIVSEQSHAYPGDFYRRTRFVTDSNRHFFVDLRARTYSVQAYPPAEQQLGHFFQLPQGYLHAALESAPATRRYVGRLRLSTGALVDAVSFTAGGNLVTIGLDPRTRLVRSATTLVSDMVAGDVVSELEFADYRPVDGVLMPARTFSRRAGEVTRAWRVVSLQRGIAIPDSLRGPPAGYAEAGGAGDSTRVLAPGVWAVRAGGSYTLLVSLGDHAMAIDASPWGSGEVLARAAALIPGQAVRYVVPTHHHDDHFPGVRDYAAAGAITVTTAGNAELFRRIVSLPRSRLRSNHAPPTANARMEIVSGFRVFSGPDRTVEVHDIGPSAHAREMLIAWLPAEGILFQADLIDVGGGGLALPGSNSATTRHLAQYIRARGWQVRTYAGAHGILRDPGEFEKLLRQPIPAQ